ncbi:hypothetical protein EG68_11753 [Paragonimus skrjabini miyazakii]|uniref:Uncharacterized protein n=1 Tax=Paragonimus skrjabini miyazakii TaxID=59628 RepID=A0A8S9YDQ8_9TREM|nr:hypothetical protein EG68_11753 [Paragonimus skrjabini miyazakii]
MSFYTEDDVIIDPAFRDADAYLVHYDYDLLGTPLGVVRNYVRNPVGFVRDKITTYKFELVFSSAIFFLLWLSYLLIRYAITKCLGIWRAMLLYWREVRKARVETKKRASQGLPVDHDIKAVALYRVLTQIHRIQSAVSKTVIPDSLITYEAIRFALETVWPTGPGLQTLAEANPFRSFENEPIEGEAEDRELEEMLSKLGMMLGEEEEEEGELREEWDREDHEIGKWSDHEYRIEERGESEPSVVLGHPEDNSRTDEINHGYMDVYSYDEYNIADWEDEEEDLNRHNVNAVRSSDPCERSINQTGGNNCRTHARTSAQLSKKGPTIDGRRFVRWKMDDVSHREPSTNQERLSLQQKMKYQRGNHWRY